MFALRVESLRRIRVPLVLAACLYLLALGLVLWAGDQWADMQAQGEARRAAQITADTRTSLLVSELQKYRLLPVVLAEQPEVAEALATNDSGARQHLDRKLETIATQLGHSIVYVLDRNGRTIAASNWRLPTSFVGQNYSFRPYFDRAMMSGSDEFFGLGTVSRQPGLFLSRRVGTGAGSGVIVVKFVFDTVERGWGPPPRIVYVTGADGVVLLTNLPSWRFATIRPLPADQAAEMRHVRQYGDVLPRLLPLRVKPLDMVDVGRVTYATASVEAPVAGWRLTALEPFAPIRAAHLATARLVMMATALGLLVPFGFWLRARNRAELATTVREMLEAEVAARTAELEATQTRFREAREALAHANRLGSIGQITAAVAHEINQPVAAIRTLSDNGAALLDLGDAATTRANLVTISGLTKRIGTITAELRAYARRGTGAPQPVALDDAIDGTLLLVGHMLRHAGLALDRGPPTGLFVFADPVRLEQIFVNLVHNAIEALAGVSAPRMVLQIDATGDLVSIILADNGGGICETVRETLFAPFTTSKPAGLGLGLGIARDIAREFGGELQVAEPAAEWNTRFLLTLRRA